MLRTLNIYELLCETLNSKPIFFLAFGTGEICNFLGSHGRGESSSPTRWTLHLTRSQKCKAMPRSYRGTLIRAYFRGSMAFKRILRAYSPLIVMLFFLPKKGRYWGLDTIISTLIFLSALFFLSSRVRCIIYTINIHMSIAKNMLKISLVELMLRAILLLHTFFIFITWLVSTIIHFYRTINKSYCNIQNIFKKVIGKNRILTSGYFHPCWLV